MPSWLKTGSAKIGDTYEQRYFLKQKYGYQEYHFGDLLVISAGAKISPRFGGPIKPLPIRVADSTGKGLSKAINTGKVWKNNLKSVQKSIKSSSSGNTLAKNLKKVGKNPHLKRTGMWLKKRPLSTGILSGTIGGSVMSNLLNTNSNPDGNLEWLVPRKKKKKWV